MIPVSLRLKGLYSYQQEEHIDFQMLVPSRLFGIFGAVGSGKSTILEAISFALYGQTERLLQSDNRNYNMMNLKSKKLEIDFIFKSGRGNDEYRFMVLGKRHSKRFEKIHSFERTAYKRVNGEWQAIESKTAEEIVGLNYENFRRTVIIPQNKFQEFLQLGPKDRTTMLKELFNLERFELYSRTTSLDTKNREKINALLARLSQLDDADAEKIAEEEQALKAIEQKGTALNQTLTDTRKKVQEMQNLKGLFEKMQQARAVYESLKTEQSLYQEREQKLKKYEYCLLHFRDILNRIDEEILKCVDLKETLRERKDHFQSLNKALAEQESEFTILKTQYQTRETLRTQREELERVLYIQKLEDRTKKTSSIIENIQAQEKELYENLLKLKSEQRTLQNAVRQLRGGMDIKEITAISEWISRGSHLKSNLDKLNQKIEQNHRQVNALQQEKSGLISSDFKGYPQFQEKMSTRELLQEAEKLLTRFRQSGRALEKDIEKKEQLIGLAGELEEGRKCPLCGSTDHTQPLEAHNIELDLKKLHKEHTRTEAAIALFDKSCKKIYRLSEQEKAARMLSDQLQSEEKEIDLAMTDHKQSFSWPRYQGDEETLSSIVEDAQKNMQTAAEKEKTLEVIQTEIEGWQQRKDELNRERTDHEQKIAANEAELKTLLKNLKTIDYRSWENSDRSDIEKHKNELEQRLGKIETEYMQVERKILSLRQEKDRLSGFIDVAQKNIIEQEKKQNELGQRLDEKIGKSEFDSSDEVREILKWNLNCENEKKGLDAYKSDLNVAGEKYNALIEETRNKGYDAQTHQALQADVQKNEVELDELRQKFGEKRTIIAAHKKALKLRNEFNAELKLLKRREEELKILKQLFKGSGFVNYVSSVYLNNLCEFANERFYRLTRKHLKLEVDENNAFQVRDFLNEGKHRSVKTLSGGQTFQAALSLALALAASIQQFHDSPQTFFFLDEGFGALDRDSLQTVMQTLKSLRQENRTVGVISHVEEMQQEIDIYLKIVNEEEYGSRIIPSWQT